MFSATIPSVMTALLIFFLVMMSVRALLLLCAIPEVWSHWYVADDTYFRTLLGAEALPSVSIVAAAYNEGGGIVERTRALLELEYPRYELVLVNDDSNDDTLKALVQAFGLSQVSPAFTVSIPTALVRGYYRSPTHPRLLVIDKMRGGAADALNAGLNAARYPYALTMADANTIVEPDALLHLTRPFLLNKMVSAAAAPLRVANGGTLAGGRFVPAVPERLWPGIQAVDMLRTFLFERLGWNRLGSNLLFPSSAALMPRDHLLGIHGFRTDAEAPETDLMARLQKYLTDRGVNAVMLVVPDAVVWTELPPAAFRDALEGGGRFGVLQVLREHLRTCFNPEYGAFGVVVLPYYWLVSIVSPFLELLGYVGLIIGGVLGVLSGAFIWAYLAAGLGYGMLLSVWTVTLEALAGSRYTRGSDLRRLFLYALAEPFGYRQITAWRRVSAFFTHRTPRPSHEYIAPSRSP